MRNSWNEEFLKRGISWNEENPETRNFLKRGKSSNEDDMVCKKSLPAVKCEHPGRKRSHRSNLHISNMDILQKKWFKSLIPARNRRSNILLHTLKGYHRLLNWHCQLSRAINYHKAALCQTIPIDLESTSTMIANSNDPLPRGETYGPW